MLVSMSETDWSDVGVSELPTGLPTGTVTLLLADVEGSTRLWETQPDEMTAAVARLDQVLAEVVANHDGVRPLEQGEGDSFVIAFARASDAVACALDLQRAPLAPIRLRIGIHTGEVRLRDPKDRSNYIGPTINRTARLRELAHGGQTVVSGATELMVVDQLPPDVSLVDLGTHPLRDLPRPERVVQLCHPELRNEFPPLRTPKAAASHNLPAQLTSFVGRQSEITKLREALASNRLVTLTGAGGAGKTRLAVQVAADLAAHYADGICYIDLAPITHPAVVPVTAARALGLPDQPGRSTVETLQQHLRDRHMLLVFDNCEHLLDASASLVAALLGAAPRLTVLATSREPLGVTGEAAWQVPSLTLSDEAIALFADRARLARAGFTVTDDNRREVTEICRRLDGMPLAIELAAARVRTLSLTEIVDSLHDRFRLLTGGSRIAVRRQQTLRASVDWSHALLTETERVLFRRLAVFLGGFDLAAAQAVAGADGVERYQVLDQLTLLVDKSLVVAESTGGTTRYRLLETVRQYALEKLGESGEADAVRSRHCDYYTSMAALLDAPARTDYQQRLEQAEIEMDNLRNALGWDLETSNTERALALASSLQPFWLARGRMLEGRAWFDTVVGTGELDELDVPAAVRARALANTAVLSMFTGGTIDPAERALAIARELGDPALLARALTACGCIAGAVDYNAEVAQTYYSEAMVFARESDDCWSLSQILAWQANTFVAVGDPIGARAAGEEGRDVANAIGDRPNSRWCRAFLAYTQLMEGDVVGAAEEFRAVSAECEAEHDEFLKPITLMGLGVGLAYQGEVESARAAADVALETASGMDVYFQGMGHVASAVAALAAGDVSTAHDASARADQYIALAQPHMVVAQRAFCSVEVALAEGDLVVARRWADGAVSVASGWHLAAALLARARVAVAEGDREEAQRYAHDALSCVIDSGVRQPLPGILECLADLARDVDSQQAARLFGAAEAFRKRTGMVRFKVHQAGYESSVAALRDTMGASDFDAAWAEGAALSTEAAIAYAQRGRGERKRPASGWAALTPAELEVVSLIRDGLPNKDIAARLFVSPRTVQAHLTHIYTKLGLASRVQLAQEAARRAPAQ
ncbi:LuxR family transcriptional regulator [Mycobacterium intermedium]|uniref:helix-turn-helix transcriptional regulator n=2 Tax=Mycobacterium intermedium TaxID=28445 RepID=UPI0008484A62|nr:LuxR family transcriptional regulator [Mycobacterium intermedium]ODR02342.1 transcriptional regulator [Mycobacterium intermedium]